MLLSSVSLFPVGGIYTVIRSKAFVSTEEMGEQYILMGPYKERSARTEVEELDFPNGNPLNVAVNKMREKGYKVSSNIIRNSSQFIYL